MQIKWVLSLLLLILAYCSYAQSEVDPDWDNQAYITQRASWGQNSMRYSMELQVRLQNDFGELQNWHFEAIATYMLNEVIELVPDFRYTRKKDGYEWRPGFGVVIKTKLFGGQLAQQIKQQVDFRSNGYISQGPRYAIFYNRPVSEHVVFSSAVGALLEFGSDFKGVQGFRGGFGFGYVFNEMNVVGINYFYGYGGKPPESNFGIIALGFRLNLRGQYDYTPARYISF